MKSNNNNGQRRTKSAVARERVLVTGADGMLGNHLVRELLSAGYPIRVLLQPDTDPSTLKGLPIQRFHGDVRDEEAVTQAVDGCTFVFHCAAITDLRAPRDLVWDVNVEGTRRVVDAAVAAKVKRLVFVGSASSFPFGTASSPGRETSAPLPDHYQGIPYMESKHAAMELVSEAVRERGLDAVVVVPSFMIGAFTHRPGSADLIKAFLDGKLWLSSHGGRNFVYAGDVATAMVNALHRGKSGERYLLAGENLTYSAFLNKTAEVSGLRPPVLTLPDWIVNLVGRVNTLREKLTNKPTALNYTITRISLLETYYSAEKATRELGMPHTPIKQAIAASIAGLKRYGQVK
ncbi:MAG: NAD-dependent epimerase/dehydratase family protein [Candidatus Lernaella stagnicola]|nr:NAD-dependent epimerase/dehydratase family protein [Candidatus Lernaella stagnicola]